MPNLAPAAATPLELAGSNLVLVYAVLAIAVIALVFGLFFRRQVLATDPGTENMQTIGAAVEEGAQAYLNRQFRTLGIFVVLVFGLLFLLPADTFGIKLGRSLFFVVGALFSALIGYLGMSLAVKANVRVASAARDGNRDLGMRIAFRTGGTVGMATVGLGLLGAAVVVLVYKGDAPKVLEGFGFGAALLAMFMRVGGGIFTKAADVGADLVGKVEAGIPEDDPRNAATIADNVGDNVGDCAGMAADLFESYAVTLVAALILGSVALGTQGLVFPLIIPAIGAVTAIIGVFITRVKPGQNALAAINQGFYISAVISAVLSVVAVFLYLPTASPETVDAASGAAVAGVDGLRIRAAVAVILGIVLAAIILWLTGHFTGTDKRPTRDVARTSRTGAATVILAGIGVGFESAVYTAVIIGAAVYGAFLLGGGSVSLALFFVAVAGTGLLTTVGVIVAMDTFGPVSDNAQGIAEMSGDIDADGARILTDLDAVGNTTKAITKGIAIATAVLAATALFGSFTDAWSSTVQNLLNTNQITEAPSQFVQDMFNTQIVTPSTLVGLLLGAAVVFLFSGLAINAVTRAAGAIVFEVRRQFREHPGIMDYTEKPEYGRVVDICTRDSLRELATPGLLAALAPVAVGFGLGIGALAGFLAGAIGTGCLMAVFLANSGGSWDNAKKIVEDGHYGGKGSAAHEATVIGDTVGDPFKDTAGPAINPLLKVMNLVSVLIAPAIVILTVGNAANPLVRYGIAIVALIIIVAAVAVSRSRDISFGGDDDIDEEPLDDDELAASPEAEDYVTGADDDEIVRAGAEADEEQSRV
jgi:K(+)-stimulated pyrophosphate-energized sodium pump